MDISTVITALGGFGAVVYGIWAFVKAKAPKAVDLAEEVVKQLSATSTTAAPARLEALEKAESLLRFFESKSNQAGSDAIVAVVKEILSSKV